MTSNPLPQAGAGQALGDYQSVGHTLAWNCKYFRHSRLSLKPKPRTTGLNATYHSIDAAVWAAKGQPGLVEVHIPAMNMHFLAAELELLEGVIA